MQKFKIATVALLALLMLLAGCTGGGGPDDGDGGGEGGGGAGDGRRIDTTSTVGKVAGALGGPKRKQVARQVTTTVDGWLDAAYVEGDYPRADFDDAYPGFTKGAAALAARQSGLLSNAAVGEKVDQVDVVKRTVSVDILAPRRTPAGATAHVVLEIALSGDIDRTDRITGRLMLTPTKQGWQVFGFDVRRNQVKDEK